MLLSHILPHTYEAQQRKSRAKDQMNFQREMSNTAYQRAMDDMRKAGLNPMLVGKLGGASTPGGAMAQTPNFGQMFGSVTSPYGKMQLEKAQIASAKASAKSTMLDNLMKEMDVRSLKQKGLSPLDHKHNPILNTGPSMLLNKFLNLIDKQKQSNANRNPSNTGQEEHSWDEQEFTKRGYILRVPVGAGKKFSRSFYWHPVTKHRIYLPDSLQHDEYIGK